MKSFEEGVKLLSPTIIKSPLYIVVSEIIEFVEAL